MPEAATLTPETQPNAEGQAAAEAVTQVAPQTTQVAATQPQQQAPKAAEPQKPETPPAKEPVKYAFKAPEGRTYDPKALGAFEALAQKAELKPEVAQELLDSVAVLTEQRGKEALEQTRAAWLAAAAADKELGSDLKANSAIALKAFERFGTPELLTWLKESGAIDHPELNRWALRVGKAVSEDGFVTGRSAPGETDPAKRMFPNLA